MSIALEMPIEPQELRRWLEREVLGLRLKQLTEELDVFRREQKGEPPTLARILGEKQAAVCENGLSALNQTELQNLLEHPSCLLELQDLICLSGGRYWDRVERPAEAQEVAKRVWQGVVQELDAPPSRNSDPASTVESSRTRRNWLAGSLGGGVLLAASLFIAAWMGLLSGPKQEWGWLREDTFTAKLEDGAYLNQLADRAGEWQTRDHSTAEELKSSLADFRRMCDLLQNSPLSQLTNEADRAWLKERCKAWANKIDGHLAELRASSKSLKDVTVESDATIEALQNALRTKANEIGA